MCDSDVSSTDARIAEARAILNTSKSDDDSASSDQGGSHAGCRTKVDSPANDSLRPIPAGRSIIKSDSRVGVAAGDRPAAAGRPSRLTTVSTGYRTARLRTKGGSRHVIMSERMVATLEPQAASVAQETAAAEADAGAALAKLGPAATGALALEACGGGGAPGRRSPPPRSPRPQAPRVPS